MASTNSLPGFQMTVNPAFIEKAQKLKPLLQETTASPVRMSLTGGKWQTVGETIPSLHAGSVLRLDFGHHVTGYVCVSFDTEGSPPDAPALLELSFGEKELELGVQLENYKGNLTASWLQQERIHVDEFPCTIKLPRRYAFRYVEIKILAISPKYQLVLQNANVRCVSSADILQVKAPDTQDAELCQLDKAGIWTLHECMQEVFEDGPKRDRRMWLGDLYLQAKTNYLTFGNTALVKRCLYLFAGLRQNEGRVGATLFVRPRLQVDDIYLFDYALFFIFTLYDYYKHTGDKETLRELYSTAQRQVEIAAERLDVHGLVKDSADWWCFIDWGEGLNKQCSAQAVFILALEKLSWLAEVLGRNEEKQGFFTRMKKAKRAIMRLYDKDKKVFRSGEAGQVSCHSQIWAVLAGVLPEEEARRLLLQLDRLPFKPQTPFMHHFYLEALCKCRFQDKAFAHMKAYWGAMLQEGADTYYESFNPDERDFSPYGAKEIESYCHAWSCTPSYFIRKYCGVAVE